MIIQSKYVWLNEELKPAQVQVEQGKITGIYPYNKEEAYIDYGDLWILPGFIDIHTHGWNKADSNRPDLELIRA